MAKRPKPSPAAVAPAGETAPDRLPPEGETVVLTTTLQVGGVFWGPGRHRGMSADAAAALTSGED